MQFLATFKAVAVAAFERSRPSGVATVVDRCKHGILPPPRAWPPGLSRVRLAYRAQNDSRNAADGAGRLSGRLRQSRAFLDRFSTLEREAGRPDGGDAVFGRPKCAALSFGRDGVSDRRATPIARHPADRHRCDPTSAAGSMGAGTPRAHPCLPRRRAESGHGSSPNTPRHVDGCRSSRLIDPRPVSHCRITFSRICENDSHFRRKSAVHTELSYA